MWSKYKIGPADKSLSKTKKKSQQSENLRIAISTLQYLYTSYNNPEVSHLKLCFYQDSSDEDVRICFDMAYNKVCQVMKKPIILRNIIEDVLIKQKELNHKMQTEINQEGNRERQKSLVEEFRKIGQVKREDQKYFRNNQFSPGLQNIMIELNRTVCKFQHLWNAIRTFRIDQNRSFTQYIEEKGLSYFQTLEIGQLSQFQANLKKKSKLDSLKNFFTTTDQDLLLIQKTLVAMDNVSNLTELENLLYINKIAANHHKIYVKFLNNSRKMVKMQKIIESLKNCMAYDPSNMSNLLSQIQCDTYLDKKTKIDLKEIGSRIQQHYQCSKAFFSMNLDMDSKTVKKLFAYLTDMGKLLKTQIYEIQQANRRQAGEKRPILESDQKIDIFKLLSYFFQLICYIKNPKKYRQQEKIKDVQKYAYYQKEEIKIMKETKDNICYQLKQKLEKKEQQVKLLKMRIYNLNQKINKYENEEQAMLERMLKESGHYQVADQDSSEQMVELQRITADVEVQTESVQETKLSQQIGKPRKEMIQHIIQGKILTTDTEIQTENPPIDLIANTEVQTKISQTEIQNLYKQIDLLRDQIIQRQKERQNTMQMKLTQQQRSKVDKIQTNQILQNLKIQIDNLKKQLGVSISKQNDKNIQIQKLQGIINDNRVKLAQFSQNYLKLQEKCQSLSIEIQLKDEESRKIIARQQELINQLQEIKQLKENLAKEVSKACNSNQCYFLCDIFADFRNSDLEKRKGLLIKAIQERANKKILSTKLIYKLDEKNTVSPHKYIDNIDNWIIFIKLKNGQIIGAFCSDGLEKTKKSTNGFLFNLRLSKFYNLKKNDKAKIYQYQQYFLVIGNSQLRYRFHTKNLQSCFGSNYKFFETERDTPAIFFGQASQNFEIETFQFYQVIFKEA